MMRVLRSKRKRIPCNAFSVNAEDEFMLSIFSCEEMKEVIFINEDLFHEFSVYFYLSFDVLRQAQHDVFFQTQDEIDLAPPEFHANFSLRAQEHLPLAINHLPLADEIVLM